MLQEEDNIGMTKDRQADIQNKMYRMFGSGVQAASSDGGKPSTKMGSMKAIGSERLKSERAIGLTDSAIEEEDEAGLKRSGSESSDEGPDHVASSFEDDLRGDDEAQEERTEWACSTCTLINKPADDLCVACGIPRYSDLYAF